MKKERPSPSDIYLDLDGFKKLCCNNRVDVSDGVLELYEENDLLYPLYRIIRPKEYLQALFEQDHGENSLKNIIEVPDEYAGLYKFEHESMQRWRHAILPDCAKAIEKGHPLDQPNSQHEAFIIQPSKGNFRSWTEYKIIVEMQCDGHPIKSTQSIAISYYSPWQIYFLEEANERHIYKVNALLQLKEGEKYNFHTDPANLSLSKWEGYFTSLWEYKFKEHLSFQESFENAATNVLEGKALTDFHDRCHAFAKHYFQQHSYESWIAFLKIICELYFRYQDSERIGLSECAKGDIRSAIELIMRGSDKEYKAVVESVGMYIGGKSYFHTPPLERIFPEYESHIRREVNHLLQLALDHYNNSVPDIYKVDKSDLSSVIDCAFKTSNETLLTSIVLLNSEYFEPSYFGEEALWSHVRSLGSAIEAWTKTMTETGAFYDALQFMTKSGFQAGCNQLAKACAKTNVKIYNISDLRLFLSILTTLTPQIGGTQCLWMNSIIRAYLIRNYSVHHTELGTDLFGQLFHTIFNSLTFLIFFAWKHRVL